MKRTALVKATKAKEIGPLRDALRQAKGIPGIEHEVAAAKRELEPLEEGGLALFSLAIIISLME